MLLLIYCRNDEPQAELRKRQKVQTPQDKQTSCLVPRDQKPAQLPRHEEVDQWQSTAVQPQVRMRRQIRDADVTGAAAGQQAQRVDAMARLQVPVPWRQSQEKTLASACQLAGATFSYLKVQAMTFVGGQAMMLSDSNQRNITDSAKYDPAYQYGSSLRHASLFPNLSWVHHCVLAPYLLHSHTCSSTGTVE